MVIYTKSVSESWTIANNTLLVSNIVPNSCDSGADYGPNETSTRILIRSTAVCSTGKRTPLNPSEVTGFPCLFRRSLSATATRLKCISNARFFFHLTWYTCCTSRTRKFDVKRRVNREGGKRPARLVSGGDCFRPARRGATAGQGFSALARRRGNCTIGGVPMT